MRVVALAVLANLGRLAACQLLTDLLWPGATAGLFERPDVDHILWSRPAIFLKSSKSALVNEPDRSELATIGFRARSRRPL